MKYHSADLGKSLKSLEEVLVAYDNKQAEVDEVVTDGIITQREAFEDAKVCMQSILDNSESIVGVVDLLALVGRLLEVEICAGTQINVFLVKVVSMPSIMQKFNSVDLYTRYNGEYKDSRGERANCLMPITCNTSANNLLRKPIGFHMCTYFLCKNFDLSMSDAFLAMQSATVTHCLGSRMSAYIEAVLTETYTSFKCVYDPSQFKKLNSYIEMVGGGDFRHCLVTSSPELPSHCTCEHLTKFVMATYVLIQRGRHFTNEELLDRMHAAMVEMVGRGVNNGSFLDYCTFSYTSTVQEILDMVPSDAALEACTLREAVKIFKSAVDAKLDGEKLVLNVSRFDASDDIKPSYFQFSRESLSTIFANLYRMCSSEADVSSFEVPDITLRQGILNHGLTWSSYERNVLHPAIPEVNLSELKQRLLHEHKRAVRDAASGYITNLYQGKVNKEHDLALTIPLNYMVEYESKNPGSGVVGLLQVSSVTFLPRNACTCPKCPWFLVPLDKTDENQSSITAKLMEHLVTVDPVQGLHVAVTKKGLKSASEVAAEIRRGSHLLKQRNINTDPVQRIKRAVANASNGNGEWLVDSIEKVAKQIQGAMGGHNPNFSYADFEKRMHEVLRPRV